MSVDPMSVDIGDKIIISLGQVAAMLEEYLIIHNEYSEDMGNNMSNMKSKNALRKCLSIEFTRSLIANKEYLRAKVN